MKVNGIPWQGLDFYRDFVMLSEKAAVKTYRLDIEAYVILKPYDGWRKDEKDFHTFDRARLAVVDKTAAAGYYDFLLAYEVYRAYKEKDENAELQDFILTRLEKALAFIALDESSPAAFQRQMRRARAYLQQHLYQSKACRATGSIALVGQSHLDIIYLWRYAETIRKNARTCANMLALMREYPAFRFVQSQPKLYEDLQKYYPDIFRMVQARVRTGQWEAAGGMYIEPDGNLPSGESFVRQILFGKRYFRRTFDVDTHIAWMPDVFGAGWSLPQILLKSGIRYFTTIKLSTWNDTNDFPHHTFWWEGLDGSRVLCHFPPTHFGEEFTTPIIRRHWNGYMQKEETGESLMLYGLADGGGGPVRPEVEFSLRLARFPGMPAIRYTSAEACFQRLGRKGARLPVWRDELYMEGHRGTYTSMAVLKKLNRVAENLYRDAEIFATLAFALGGRRAQERINEGWKYVLTNQFHDTITGSHIKACVPDILKDYQAALAIGNEVATRATGRLAQRIDTARCRKPLVVLNTLSWERTDICRIPLDRIGADDALLDDEGRDVPCQVVVNEEGRKELAFVAAGVPGLGYRVYDLVSGKRSSQSPPCGAASANSLENEFFSLRMDADGLLTSLYDKVRDREVLAPGRRGNELQLFEDKPGRFSAWDIIAAYEKTRLPVGRPESIRVRDNGPVAISLTIARRIFDSTVRQDIVLYRQVPRIDFRTQIAWREREKLLKVAFHLAVNAMRATYDIPFGNIERPTHRNTSWDEAKFEVWAHKWADLAEGDYGVALLNDCKYGYDVKDNVMRLTLLKGPVHPNPDADLGMHRFTYSLYPHGSGWREGGVLRAGCELNAPLRAGWTGVHRGELPRRFSFAQCSKENFVLETLKQAEDSDHMVLRGYEAYGQRGTAEVAFFKPLRSVKECNLMEEEEWSIRPARSTFSFPFLPYEIKTFKLQLS